MKIEIIQTDDDSTDYIKKITEELNKRFTTQENMELRAMTHCAEISDILGGRVVFGNDDSALFIFGNVCITDDAALSLLKD